MKKVILAIFASFALPTAVNAESYWLVFFSRGTNFGIMEKIEMESMTQCEEQGTNLKKSWRPMGGQSKFICLRGK